MASDMVIVSYATRGRENYPSVLPRLVTSARAAGYDGDFMLCSPDGPTSFSSETNHRDLTIPPHSVTPYGFKPHLIRHARRKGYRFVMWFDSTIFSVRDFKDVRREFRRRPCLLFDNPGCYIPIWTSDDCLAKMGCDVSEVTKVSQISACAMGFDFESKDASETFEEWFAVGEDGVSFKGASKSSRPEFKAHRHDQSAMSVIRHRRKIEPVTYGFLAYWHHKDKFNSVLCNRGIGQP